ncbi:MAG: RDD family protein [Snowella sp.]|nr:RDD family protein [Snowella sp.]
MSLCINPNCSNPTNPDLNRFCQSCGSELILVNRYRVTRLLSNKGGFANTYEVQDKDQLKVLKVLTNSHPHAIALFQQEAQVLNELNHPGIPHGEGYFTYFLRNHSTPLHCLVMEKIEGVDLEEYLYQKQYQPIDQTLALEWLEQLAKILGKVHHHNFFHRDIKPSNIILKPNGQLVLIDFGAVRQVTQTILAGGQNTRLFTSGYAPPEQERGYAVQQSDFFALGRTFVFLLTGKDPNSSDIYDYQHNELNWRKLAPQVDAPLADFIDLLMADKVNQRPENIDAILTILKKLKKQLNIVAKTQPLPLQIPTSPHGIALYHYAGFWIRTKAAIVDSVIVLILAAIAGSFIGEQLIATKLLAHWTMDLGLVPVQNFLFTISLFSGIGTTPLGYLIPLIFLILWFVNPSYFLQHYSLSLGALMLGVVIKWLYFVIFEASPLKATLGKLLFGLVVVDNEGYKISLKQANKRYWAKVVSISTLYIGYCLAGWTKKKRALHDMIAGTLIVKKD